MRKYLTTILTIVTISVTSICVYAENITDLQEKSNQIIADAQAEASSLKSKATKEIAQQKEQAIAEIRNDISDIAILAASKVLEEDIDKSKHEDLIQKFIKEVGEAE